MGPWTRQTKELMEAGAGMHGSKAIVDTTKYDAPEGFCISFIEIVAETVVSTQTNYGTYASAELSDFTALPAGLIIPTQLSSITLTSGEVNVFLLKIVEQVVYYETW